MRIYVRVVRILLVLYVPVNNAGHSLSRPPHLNPAELHREVDFSAQVRDGLEHDRLLAGGG